MNFSCDSFENFSSSGALITENLNEKSMRRKNKQIRSRNFSNCAKITFGAFLSTIEEMNFYAQLNWHRIFIITILARSPLGYDFTQNVLFRMICVKSGIFFRKFGRLHTIWLKRPYCHSVEFLVPRKTGLFFNN